MKQDPKISVITPSYNSGLYIERAIQSVLIQDYPNWEHIIMDGGSTDKTVSILKKYRHLTWVSRKDKGQAHAMNEGFRKSKGDVIVYLNADDYFYPGAFSEVVRHFKKGADFVVGNIIVNSQRLNWKFINKPRVTLQGMMRHWEPNAFPHNPVGYFYRRRVQTECPFNTENVYTMDLEFLLEAASRFKFTKTEFILGYFEDGAQTKTSKSQSMLDYWTKETFPYIDTYLKKLPEKPRQAFIEDRRQGYAALQSPITANTDMKTQLLKPKTLPSVSVIIPTYNHREYILRAVKSSLSQHIPKIEVIVVDDASTDGTYDLLARTYKANRKVRIIRHHVNGKLGAARNTGLSHAKGKYVFFLDADDWLEKGALHTLLSVAVRYGADVVSCGVNKVWPDGRKEFFHGHGFSCTDKEDALSHLAEYSIGSIAWNKLYLRDLLEKNKIRFTTPYWHEDVLFTMKCIYRCRKYISIPNPFYNYLQRTTSIVNGRQTVLHLRSYIRLILDTVRFAKDNGIPGNGEIDGLTLRLLKSHSFTDLRSNLIRYKNSRKKTEWQDDVFEACSLEMGMWGRVVASGIISVFDQMEFSAPAVHPGNQVFTRSETRLVNMVRKIKHAVIPASSKRKRIFDLTKKALKRFVRRGQSSHPLL